MLAGGIAACMQDAGYAVGRLSGEGDFAIHSVEVNPEIDQVGDTVRGFIDEDTHRVEIAQASPGSDSVLIMDLGGIAYPDGGGNAPLSMPATAFTDAALGQDEHAPLPLRQQRSV
ncbi:hypothetical protein ES707_04710 [subsurface metagenome]